MTDSQNTYTNKQIQLKDELLTKPKPPAKQSKFRRSWIWFGARAWFIGRHNETIWGKRYSSSSWKFDLNGSSWNGNPLTN